MSAGTLVLLIGAFAVMPVATAIAIFFLEPLILTVLSVLLLGETAGWRRFVAIGIGMVGALIVIRPNWAAFGWPAIFPVGAAACFAILAISIRKLSPVMNGLAIQFWFSVFAGLVLGIPFVIAVLFGFVSLGFPHARPDGHGPHPGTGAFVLGDLFHVHRSVPANRSQRAGAFPVYRDRRRDGARLSGFRRFPPMRSHGSASVLILASGLYVFSREHRQAAMVAEAPRG